MWLFLEIINMKIEDIKLYDLVKIICPSGDEMAYMVIGIYPSQKLLWLICEGSKEPLTVNLNGVPQIGNVSWIVQQHLNKYRLEAL